MFKYLQTTKNFIDVFAILQNKTSLPTNKVNTNEASVEK